MKIKRIKETLFIPLTHERNCSINYLRSVRDDRRDMLWAKAQLDSYVVGARGMNYDGMPKGASKPDPIGNSVVLRRKVKNKYVRAAVLYTRSITDLMFRIEDVNDTAKQMLLAHYVKDVPVKNIMMARDMSKSKVYEVLNYALDVLYENLDEDWKE